MNDLPTQLRALAKNDELLWTVPRRAIEDALVDLRDSCIFIVGRKNGLVINYPDGTPSTAIRFGPETAVKIALNALADHLEKADAASSNERQDGDHSDHI